MVHKQQPNGDSVTEPDSASPSESADLMTAQSAPEVPAETDEALLASTQPEDDSPPTTMVGPDPQAATQPEPENTPASSIKAQTHSKSKKQLTKKPRPEFGKLQPRWLKLTGFIAGSLALVALLLGGVLSQNFKGKTMPNVYVAGVNSGSKTTAEVKNNLNKQLKNFKVTIVAKDKTLQPQLAEIGYSIDVNKTTEQTMQAKRRQGIWQRLAFWQRTNVPASLTLNKDLLHQYIDANTQELSQPPQDAQLQFDVKNGTFVLTTEAAGKGPDFTDLEKSLQATTASLKPQTITAKIAERQPTISKTKLEALLAPANQLVAHRVVLTGLGRSYVATKADIASWITPTPQSDGSIKLVVDPAKVQSYVDTIGKRISSAPQDKKVLKDETTGSEITLQVGQDGTELAGRTALATAITTALSSGQDVTQVMNIQTASYKTVNMNAYDKWIEVDLSEQRTTAYERAAPVKNFVVATGMRGHETVIGEFEIWYKNRRQTMQGGSKADGSYYSIPNVEWVSYFYKDYALHGAWWREKFGAPASHGCVNMSNSDAQWVYEWAPIGTKVIVHS